MREDRSRRLRSDRRDAGDAATRRRVLQSLGAVGAVGLAGCLGGADPGDTPSPTGTESPVPTGRHVDGREVQDATGRTVELPDAVEDVVAVGPGMLGMVAYLDATDMVVGVEQTEHSWGKNIPYNMANPELRERQAIGPHKGGDAELIADVEPDVVLATYFTAGAADDLQGKIDRPVVVVKSESRPLHRMEAAYDDFRFVGQILGKSDRADEVIEFFRSERERLADLGASVPDEKRPSAYYAGRSHSGGAGATSTQHPFAPFAFVDVDNVADSVTGHADVNEEKLLTWDPDVIFVAGSNLDRVTETLSAGQYSNLTAVEEGNLYTLLPTRFYGNLYGNVIADAYYVGTVLYPEAFSDVDPVGHTEEIHRTLLGASVYDQLAEAFAGFRQIDL